MKVKGLLIKMGSMDVIKQYIGLLNRRTVFCVLICFVCMNSTFGSKIARDGSRDFLSADGRTIRGRIIKYDKNRKKIFFVRDTKRKMWVSPSAFSQEDQEYIRKWIDSSHFLLESSLKISIKKVKMKESNKKTVKKAGVGYTIKDGIITYSENPKEIIIRSVLYEINIVNNTGKEIKNVEIEMACLVKENGYSDANNGSHWVFESIRIPCLKTGKDQYQTESIELLEVKEIIIIRNTPDGGVSRREAKKIKKRRDKVSGVWFRVFGPKLEGEVVFRDVSLPGGFFKKHNWKEVNLKK